MKCCLIDKRFNVLLYSDSIGAIHKRYFRLHYGYEGSLVNSISPRLGCYTSQFYMIDLEGEQK